MRRPMTEKVPKTPAADCKEGHNPPSLPVQTSSNVTLQLLPLRSGAAQTGWLT